MSKIDGQCWQPDVTVATVVVRDGKLLLVDEYAGGTSLVLNQPAGHLEPDETLAEAAVRETFEETGWDVELTHFIGAYQWRVPEGPNAGKHYLRFAFAATPLRHHAAAKLDDGIERAVWLAPEQLQAQQARWRSPLVWQVARDFLAGQRHPLSLLKHLA